MLREGIPAVKFNFSNDQVREVMIYLADDGQSFEYTTDSLITRRRKCKFGLFNGLLYGGQTMSFSRHKKRLIKLLKNQEQNQEYKQEDITIIKRSKTRKLEELVNENDKSLSMSSDSFCSNISLKSHTEEVE